ncbi:hypothetical protein E2C01_068092 [Portunus trituberculatus]|uniref:Uncharacterized protein n=1 Tax=Portunus trituberculatus TaxID=210409 RepID=A0A5B7HVD6_PORTR|nr:hypothetical protein [Portunus trituberculatus]
MSEMRLLHR